MLEDAEGADAESNASLTANEALLRVRTGVTLVLLDVPRGSTVTIDLRSFVTGPNFKGFKAIPPTRTHLITLTPTGTSSESNPIGTTGVFFSGSKGDVLVAKYCAESEALADVQPASASLVQDVRLLRLDGELGFYSKAADTSWAPLVACVDPPVLHQVGVSFGTCISGAERNLVVLGENAKDGDRDSSLAQCISFAPIDLQAPLRGMTAEEITKFHIDRSQMVEDLIRTRFNGRWEGLIGELQVAFLSFLLLFNLEGLEHWKALLTLLTACDRLQLECPELFIRFTAVLFSQMKVVPVEIFTEKLETENFLRISLERYFLILSEQSALDLKLKTKSRKFKDFVVDKYGWSFEDGTNPYERRDSADTHANEEGPTIVPYHEVQKVLGLQNSSNLSPSSAPGTH